MQSFAGFASAPKPCSPCCLSNVTSLVSCCGYLQNMMQGKAVSEKHVAGGSALPGERDLTLIVADEGWLHYRHSDTRFPSTDKTATILGDCREKRTSACCMCNLQQQITATVTQSVDTDVLKIKARPRACLQSVSVLAWQQWDEVKLMLSL